MCKKLPTTAPTSLKHKPIYTINRYAKVDRSYDKPTDVVALSIGKAQWAQEDFDVGVKVWRYKGRFSRQSEETTITRALDMATLIVKVLDKHYNGAEIQPVKSIYGKMEIDAVGKDSEDFEKFDTFLQEHNDDITAHLAILYDALYAYMNR